MSQKGTKPSTSKKLMLLSKIAHGSGSHHLHNQTSTTWQALLYCEGIVEVVTLSPSTRSMSETVISAQDTRSTMVSSSPQTTTPAPVL